MDASYPDTIADVETLDELLTRPTPAVVETMRGLEGDILVVGASGKMGPTLAVMARRAVTESGVPRRVFAAARSPMPALEARGITTIRCDVVSPEGARMLPEVPNVIYMVGRKFGSSGSESETWATNAGAAWNCAERFRGARVVALSTGCVYPLAHADTGGSTEATPVGPVGEYAMSCLARERLWDSYADRGLEAVTHVRLNYAVEMRYGVLADIALKVRDGIPVDLTTGYANVIWQGSACDRILRCLPLCSSPARILNLTGPELLRIRDVAQTLGETMRKPVRFRGEENGLGYLSNAAEATALFGPPEVTPDGLLRWTADWVSRAMPMLGKPTKFEVQNGRY